jgi:hypothetical protein
VDRECEHFSLLNSNFFLLIGISQIFTQLFLKATDSVCCFLEEFLANSSNVPTKGKRRIALCSLHKSLARSKGFDVRRQKTYYFNITMKVQIKSNEEMPDHLLP